MPSHLFADRAGALTGQERDFLDENFGFIGWGYASIQSALNSLYGVFADLWYDITVPLIWPSLSHFSARRQGAAITGIVTNNKFGIRKTGNAQANVINFQTHIGTLIDCITYLDPNWVDNGVSFPQKLQLENLNFVGDATVPNFCAIYLEQGGFHDFKNLSFSNVVHGLYAKEIFSSRVNFTGLVKCTVKGGTSVVFDACNTGASGFSNGGFDFTSLIYSTMNSCAVDGGNNTSYRFVSCILTLNACGCEGGTTATGNSGSAMAIDSGNDITLNDFTVVPPANLAIAVYTVGANNKVRFFGGTSYFAVAGITAPDMYIFGNGSTVVFDDYTFLSGATNTPNIQFAVGVTTSIVIVRSGLGLKTYTTTGIGNTIITTIR